MAVVMLRQSQPHKFQSDRAVTFQVARQVLRLAPREMPRYWDHKRQAVRTVHRDHPARVLELFGEKLVETFGGAAAQLHLIELRRKPPEQVEAEQLTAALASLRA